MAEGQSSAGEGGRAGADVGARAKYLRVGSTVDEGALVVTLTRSELSSLVRDAVADALGMKSGPVLLDKQGLAHKLGCSASHIDVLRKRGLPTLLVGQAVRFEVEAVFEWLRGPGGEDSSDAA